MSKYITREGYTADYDEKLAFFTCRIEGNIQPLTINGKAELTQKTRRVI